MGGIAAALGCLLLVASIVAAVWLAQQGEGTLALLAPLIMLSALLTLRHRRDSATFMRRLLVLAGLVILAAIEIVYLRDFLADTEWRRMNTVFKFYIQAWVLLGLALGARCPRLWRWLRAVARGWLAPGRACAPCCCWRARWSIPLLAMPARVNERFPSASPPRGTLDGTAYMTTA